MKPITDDFVFSIMQGLEKRERSRRAVLNPATAALHEKILNRDGTRRMISLDFATRRVRRTVSGMFCYVARG